MHAVAVEYPYSTIKGTPTYSSHSSTALYETYVAGQEECGRVTVIQIIKKELRFDY